MSQQDDSSKRPNNRKAKLLSRTHFADVRGNVWATDKATGLLIAPPIYNVIGLQPDYQNLLACAPMAFEVIDHTIGFMELLIGALEENEMDTLVPAVLDAQSGLYASQTASLFGLQSVTKPKNSR